MDSVNTTKGIEAIKSGNFEEAFKILKYAFFIEADVMAGCYLAMMYFDVKITPRTEESQAKAMLIWNMTKDKVVSSKHKLGVNLYGSKIPETKNLGYQYITEAASKGYSVAHCVLGALYHASGQYGKAEAELLQYDNCLNDKRACLIMVDCLIKNDHLKGEYFDRAVKYLGAAVDKFNDSTKEDLYVEVLRSGVSPDTDERLLKIYDKHANAGDIDTILELARIYRSRSMNHKVREYLQIGANKFNDPKCQYEYAFLYQQECLKEPEEYEQFSDYVSEVEYCIYYVQRAVDGGYDGKTFLAWLYLEAQNSEKAFKYARESYLEHRDTQTLSMYEAAAGKRYLDLDFKRYGDIYNFNDPIIKELIGHITDFRKNNKYERIMAGTPVYPIYLFHMMGNQGIAEAYEYFKQYPNNKIARLYLAIGTERGFYRDFFDNMEEADNELIGCTQFGYPLALFETGCIFRKGRQFANALEAYSRSYNNGYLPAAMAISDMYMKGEVTGRRDKKKAAEWQRKANGGIN